MSEVALPTKIPGHLELLRELEEAGALTPTSLDLSGVEIDFKSYELLCTFLGSLGRSYCWWVGDLINWGEKLFGEYAPQAIEAIGLHPGTCTNYAYTCSRVARSRRRPELSFAHHRVVTALPPDRQMFFLEEAATKGWTRQDLSEAVLEERALTDPYLEPTPPTDPLAHIVHEDPVVLFEKAMAVAQALHDFNGEIGHAPRCWIFTAGNSRIDCACGLAELEAAVSALGVDWGTP